ncbi:MAG: dTMP kinase [Candidatus Dormibacteria bacterium]
MSHEGFFISFEGLDGAGKSTQVASLGAALRADGHEVITVRPNDTELGDMVAGVVLQHQQKQPLHPWTEALLFNAGRVQLLHEVILPALDSGAVVIADRYTDSTLAYQGGGRGLDLAALRRLHADVCGEIWPDLTILLDIDHGTAAQRQHAQQLPLDRFESAAADFHQRVHATFADLAAAHPQRIVTVDARRPAVQIANDVLRLVASRLAGRTSAPRPAVVR